MNGGAPEMLCTSVTSSFDADTVLLRLNLTVPAGQITSLLGPSGCGKTTLIKHFLGLQEPDEGMLHIGNCDIWNASPGKLRAVRQNSSALLSGSSLFLSSLSSSVSVKGNLLAVLREKEKQLAKLEGSGRERDIDDPYYGLWPPRPKDRSPRTDAERELNQRADECLQKFGLSDVADLMVEQLAARTMRRAALARALIADASLYILDDPETAFDAPSSGPLIHATLDAYERTGATMLIATHDLSLAELVSDHVAVMGNGEIVAQGEPRGVLDGVESWHLFGRQFQALESSETLELKNVSSPADGRAAEGSRVTGYARFLVTGVLMAMAILVTFVLLLGYY